MKIIFTDSSRSVMDSELFKMLVGKHFQSGANYTLRKQARFWPLRWARKNKMSASNIKLSGSTVIPCKWPVSQLFRSFDFIS